MNLEETIRIEAPAFFYRQDQRRDKGRFADEGKGRQPGQRITGNTQTATQASAGPKPLQRGPDIPIGQVNVSATANRGPTRSSVAEINGYYSTTRYKGWLADIHGEAQRLDLTVEDVVKSAGVWQGTLEPSASIWVQGDYEKAKKMAMSIGGEYNQDGVVLFSSAKDDGSSTMYTLTEVPDPDEAVASMRKNGIDGGRLVQGKGGQYSLEVIDFDGSLHDQVVALSDGLNATTFWTPGKAEMLEAGTDYQKHPRQHKGKLTHAGQEAQDMAGMAGAAK